MNMKLRSKLHWVICFASVVVVSVYWLLIASDKYLSETNVVLETPQLAAPTLNFSSLLGGGGKDTGDMLLLRDYLLSVDMLKLVESEVGFKEHYSKTDWDFFSRLSSENVTIEELHEYYLNRVSIELDEYAKVLRIKVESFSPEVSYEIVNLLIAKGEAHMNHMGQRLASEQVRFLENQVSLLNENFDAARQELLDYQNNNGLVSPTGTVENLSAVVASLEAKLASLKAEKKVLRSYQSTRSPQIKRVATQISALEEQIVYESKRMAKKSGNALNSLSSEYQTLELRAMFAQESYSGALAALETTRIEAARKLKQVSILQSPTFAEYSVKPRRIYNMTVYLIIALFLTLILQMLILIVRDHRD